MNQNILIILNVPDFPFGFAFSHQILSISQIIFSNKGEVLILNNSIPKKKFTEKIRDLNCEFNGVCFKYTAGLYESDLSKLRIIIFRIIGFFKELGLILKSKNRNAKSCIMISFVSFVLFLYYRILSWLSGYKLIISIMEYHRAISVRNPLKKLSFFLFDSLALKMADGIIAISPNLYEYAKRKAPSKKIILIPNCQENLR